MSRLSRGWQITRNSFSILGANKSLIIFPILSGLMLIAVFASFFWSVFFSSDSDFGNSFLSGLGRYMYVMLFLFYMVSYFIITFFNMALVHCTTLYLRGEDASVSRGLSFSFSRFGLILGCLRGNGGFSAACAAG